MKDFKGFIAGVLTTILIMAMITTVFAAPISKMLEATFRDIKITVDGQLIEPKDTAGNIVEPFIVDGTTYLPVRAVAGAVGYDVGWDNDTNTVILTKIPEDIPPLSVIDEPLSPAVDAQAPPEEDKRYDLLIVYELNGKLYSLYDRDFVPIFINEGKTYIGFRSLVNLISVANNDYIITDSRNPFLDGHLDYASDQSSYMDFETIHISVTETIDIITFKNGDRSMIIRQYEGEGIKIIDGRSTIDIAVVKEKLGIEFDYEIDTDNKLIIFRNAKNT